MKLHETVGSGTTDDELATTLLWGKHLPREYAESWELVLQEVARVAPATCGDEFSLEGGTIGGFSVVRPLGAGSFGTVYEAVHSLIGKEVAIKVLRSRFTGSAKVENAFIDEGRVINRIRHPSIVDVFGVGELA